MFGLPADFDPAFLVGKELESASFGQTVLNLHLSGSTLIRIECTISGDNKEAESLPGSILLVYPLIGFSIRSASSQRDGTLFLQFENDKTLRIYDSNARYESYHILKEDGTTLVV